MNILVTGIHGFVGSNLVNALKYNHILYGLDIISPAKEGVIKTFLWKDIESADSIHELPHFDAIIHLAGKAHDTKNQSAAQIYFDINTGLTQKIFDFFLQSSARHTKILLYGSFPRDQLYPRAPKSSALQADQKFFSHRYLPNMLRASLLLYIFFLPPFHKEDLFFFLSA